MNRFTIQLRPESWTGLVHADISIGVCWRRESVPHLLHVDIGEHEEKHERGQDQPSVDELQNRMEQFYVSMAAATRCHSGLIFKLH